MFIVCIIALLGKMSMLFSFTTDKIRNCFAVQWGDQQYLWCLPEIDQRRINHTEAGCGLHQWNWIPSKCKCAQDVHWNSRYATPDYCFGVHGILLPIKKLPLSKAQNCCTAKTSDWQPGLEHQSKLIRFHYGDTTAERRDEEFHTKNPTLFIFSLLCPLQGGAEHNVPVVISKIFKDQVGKKS